MNRTLPLNLRSPAAKADTYPAPYGRALAFIAMLWCIPTLLTLMQFDSAQIAVATLFVGTITCALMIWRPFYTLVGLPFFALLAPAGGFIELLGVRAVLTDWLMIVLAGQVLYLAVVSSSILKLRLQRNSASGYLFPLAIVFLLSYVFNFLLENISSGAALYYLLSFVLIYFYFSRYARTENEWHAIFWAWALAALLGSLILIRAFMAGETLVDFAMDSDILVDRASMKSLYRASYYYAGFHFVAGIFAVSLLLRLVFKRDAILRKLAVGASLVFLLLALFVMLNKTAIISTLISFIIIYIIIGLRLKSINIASLSIFAVFGFLAIAWFVAQYGEDLYQGTEQITDSVTSTDSFMIRTQVWINALQVLMDRPWHLIFGLGPNFIETGDPQLAELFKVAADSGGLEGALDSSWLTFLIELGVFGLLLLVGLFAKAFSIVRQYLRQMPAVFITDSSFLTVFGGLVYLVLAFIPQSLGYGKISWLPFQLVLVAFAYVPVLQGRAHQLSWLAD